MANVIEVKLHPNHRGSSFYDIGQPSVGAVSGDRVVKIRKTPKVARALKRNVLIIVEIEEEDITTTPYDRLKKAELIEELDKRIGAGRNITYSATSKNADLIAILVEDDLNDSED